jgi:hypothetical protein
MVSDTPVLVSKSEVSWLRGELKVAKYYERRLRFNIKHKFKALGGVELPLLADKGFFSNDIDVTANCNGVTILTPFLKRGKSWMGFGPRTVALPRLELSFIGNSSLGPACVFSSSGPYLAEEEAEENNNNNNRPSNSDPYVIC